MALSRGNLWWPQEPVKSSVSMDLGANGMKLFFFVTYDEDEKVRAGNAN